MFGVIGAWSEPKLGIYALLPRSHRLQQLNFVLLAIRLNLAPILTMYRVTDHSARAIYLIITIQNYKSLQTILIGTVNIYIEQDSSTPQLSKLKTSAAPARWRGARHGPLELRTVWCAAG